MTKSGPIPKRPSRKSPWGPPLPPLPPYLPMRYVRTEQYLDIWPNEAGSPYPSDNLEYPQSSPDWCSLHDEQFYDWLLAKNVEPKWFHQQSKRKIKQQLLDEFFRQWLEEGDYPYPKRRLWIQNYGGHQDMFYNPDSVNRLFAYILYFVGWLNRLTGAEKPKRKTNGEQMATLAELFEGYEDNEEHPDWKLACAMDRHFEGKIKTAQQAKIDRKHFVANRERGTPHTTGW